MIGYAVDHLLDQGVSRIIAVDHLSSDATPRLLAERGERVTVVPYRHPAYAQSSIMTALARHAAAHGAEWVIPFDADEIWWARDDARLAEYLRGRIDDVVEAEIVSFVPTAKDSDDENPIRRLTYRFEQPDGYPKVAFRADPGITVGMGNHAVEPQGATGGGLVIAHYPYRNREQFIRKFKYGRAGLISARLPVARGDHWRGLGALSEEELSLQWDDYVTTHLLPDHNHLPLGSALVDDPGARLLRTSGGNQP